MSRYRFIQREKAVYPIVVLCRVLRVACSAYYAWARHGISARAQADADLLAQIDDAHVRSRRTYGALRVHAELRAPGTRCARMRVARLMRAAGLVGGHRRGRARTIERAGEPCQRANLSPFSGRAHGHAILDEREREAVRRVSEANGADVSGVP